MITPLITVITISFNDKSALELTIKSVISQSYRNVEFIVIDGGSTDGSIDIIKKYKDSISHWVSEKDSGIYDAMNKGLRIAGGDFFMMLNSGDLFHHRSSLAEMVNRMNSPESIYFGRALVKSPVSSYLKPSEKVSSIDDFIESTLPIHQSVLVPASLKYQHYDTSFRIAGDSDYLRRLFNDRMPTFVPVDMVIFNLGGVSSFYRTFYHYKVHLKEHLLVIWRHESHKIYKSLYVCLTFTLKYIAGKFMHEKSYYGIIKRLKGDR